MGKTKDSNKVCVGDCVFIYEGKQYSWTELTDKKLAEMFESRNFTKEEIKYLKKKIPYLDIFFADGFAEGMDYSNNIHNEKPGYDFKEISSIAEEL